ncbi:glutathione S-transferase family protein [Marinobacterium sp. D7]|uniref:glutathione S-transferase family protein n=1 Tax=Marinobacterium ramblicola TaxID=2849041 RepID=UPI001C2D29BD|nr:glutathione S-transferase family protein [Marinobacterium ramblicola]MBV1790690.1 glutathione S-transferase family protein [Marinobacterium ramblicola]
MELVIGNKNYSSWSLRGWLVLKWFDLPFTEVRLLLDTDSFKQQIAQYSDAGKVPVLIDDGVRVWDSLAIAEYINDAYLQGTGWPRDMAERALARAISCEMHSGFFKLRQEMPMNCRARRVLTVSDACAGEIQRIDNIWSGLRQRFASKGPWLFGERSIADAMFAPVALRFHTYDSELSGPASEYVRTVLNDDAISEWMQDAQAELQVLDAEEKGSPAD